MKQVKLLQSKITSTSELETQLKTWRFHGQKIVFTNGCFDLLHLGHIDYLAKARDLGDRLIIGLNTDTSVQGLKGLSRPVKDEMSRAHILAAMQFVDAVIFFDEETPIDLISWVKPDVLVKGGDYTIEGIVGHEIVLENGGEVKTIAFVEGYSSTKLIDKIIKG
jgi:D-glycero-beta-D-manno-heptose 1-phosphate adenylyltransferase